jgi:hypothetical protein
MTIEFKVWCPDTGDKEDADIVLDVLPQFAAEHWVEENHGDLDYPDEIEIHVEDPKGKLTIWTVSCEMQLTCHAVEKNEKEKT